MVKKERKRHWAMHEQINLILVKFSICSRSNSFKCLFLRPDLLISFIFRVKPPT